MLAARHDGFSAGLPRRFEHAFVVGCDDTAVGDVHFTDTLPDLGNEGCSAKEPQWFMGESNGCEARRDYDQRPHPPPEIARLDAKVTPVNIGRISTFREENLHQLRVYRSLQ
jgi:hypothetical protein